MARRMFPKRKRPSLPSSVLIEFGSPQIYYDAQEAFQYEGVLLVDLEAGTVISGQVNVSDIGLVEPGKTLKVIHQMGYVQPSSENEIAYAKMDIDAVLVLDQSSQRPGEPFYLLIRVVEHEDIDLWSDLALRVARKLVTSSQGHLTPKVTFGITSLSRGVSLDSSARNTALRKIRTYSLDTIKCISDFSLIQDDTYEEGQFGHKEIK